MGIFKYKDVEMKTQMKSESDYIDLNMYLARSLTITHSIEDSKWSSYFYSQDRQKFTEDRFMDDIINGWEEFNFAGSNYAKKGVDMFLSSLCQWKLKKPKQA